MLIVDIITLYKLVKLFMIHIFSKHSVLTYIISDYETEFISNFFRSLETALNMKLYFTSKYHPKEDRQTEYNN